MIRLLSLTFFTAIFLSGCGFKPMHATQAGQSSFNDVQLVVEAGEDEVDRLSGFELRQSLRDRIGTNPTARYTLTVDPRASRIPLGLTGLDRASRFDSRLSARWVLTETETSKQLASGTTDSTTTFAADNDPYRLNTTDNAARTRVAQDVADQLLVDLALYFADNPTP